MRLLLIIVCAVAGIYGGYWYLGQRALETQLAAWFDGRHSAGWVAEYSALNTRGFPNRFDTTIEDIELADPATGLVWVAPFFQILALSYKPNHIIAVWPNAQSLATPNQHITIRSDEMKGSLVFNPGPSLALNRASFVLRNFNLTSDAGWSAHIGDGLLALRQSATKSDFYNFYDLAFEATGIKPTSEFLKAMDPAGLLPDSFKILKIDATAGFDAPWDRFAIEDRRPQVTELNLKLVQASWGDLDLQLAGKLRVDAEGFASGSITVKAKNWREMLNIALASGLLPERYGPPLARGLSAIAGMSGNPNTIDAPLTFRNGGVWLGFVPLGPAPRLAIR